ncbi:hypothetical protein ZWY2020_040058 [Hordeum vulgare]|nr:hypothetical protein ZWY2020_040058 [Hordeum vulgare]
MSSVLFPADPFPRGGAAWWSTKGCEMATQCECTAEARRLWRRWHCRARRLVRKGYISSGDGGGSWACSTSPTPWDARSTPTSCFRLESRFAASAATLPPAKEALCLLELIGVDRPRLLSEVFAVLAALVFVRDKDPGAPIHDAAEQRGGGEAGQDSAEPGGLRAVGWAEEWRWWR